VGYNKREGQKGPLFFFYKNEGEKDGKDNEKNEKPAPVRIEGIKERKRSLSLSNHSHTCKSHNPGRSPLLCERGKNFEKIDKNGRYSRDGNPVLFKGNDYIWICDYLKEVEEEKKEDEIF